MMIGYYIQTYLSLNQELKIDILISGRNTDTIWVPVDVIQANSKPVKNKIIINIEYPLIMFIFNSRTVFIDK